MHYFGGQLGFAHLHSCPWEAHGNNRKHTDRGTFVVKSKTVGERCQHSLVLGSPALNS